MLLDLRQYLGKLLGIASKDALGRRHLPCLHVGTPFARNSAALFWGGIGFFFLTYCFEVKIYFPNYVREWRNFNVAKICFLKKLCNQKVTSHYHHKTQYLCKALDLPSVQHPSWAGMDFICVLYARKKTKSRRGVCRWPSRKSMAVSWLNSKANWRLLPKPPGFAACLIWIRTSHFCCMSIGNTSYRF